VILKDGKVDRLKKWLLIIERMTHIAEVLMIATQKKCSVLSNSNFNHSYTSAYETSTIQTMFKYSDFRKSAK
jgi:hypothetical protein